MSEFMPRISLKVSKNIPAIYIFYLNSTLYLHLLFTTVRAEEKAVFVCYHLCIALTDSDTGCLPSALRSDSTPVLCGVTRVGLVAKGLLIKGDMDLELVLMCREKPTKLLLYTISANLPLQIQVRSSHTPSTAVFSMVHPKWALKHSWGNNLGVGRL